jgi:uncharacterized hydrophobic protein (TIGR00271 family)
MEKFFAQILSYLNLESEVEEFDRIHSTIEKDVIFKGTNLWILVFAIIVASVGLNMNSTAVIIGAMLISPLMGPINGMGYSIATYNFPLLRKAIKNFLFAVAASLVASTIYFALSPVSTAHSELLARTSPTIYDVLIALFGGLAGIVAISSRQKGNVIPGVAIATALMPPLCTAGYGLATAQFTYFFGALYLFTINTVFIALSSVFVSQILKFPIRTIVNEKQKKKVNQIISAIIAITVIPSIYFGYILVQNERFNENALKYTQSLSVFEGNYLLKSDINVQKKTISLLFAGNSLSENHKALIKEKATIFSLGEAEIKIEQGLSFGEMMETANEIDQLKNEISRLQMQLAIKGMKEDSIVNRLQIGKDILQEIKPLFPHVTSTAFAESYAYNDTALEAERISIVVIKGKAFSQNEKEKIRAWMEARLKSKKVKTYFENS